MTRTTLLLLGSVVAACGGPAQPEPARPADPTDPVREGGPAAVSLERIERIARACLAGRDGTPLDWGTIAFARSGTSWRVRVDETKPAVGNASYVDVMVAPDASTCDGAPIDSAPEAGDAGVEAVTAIARRCHTGKIDEAKTEVMYHRLATGAFDRGRYDVTFREPGAVTFPLPHYLVDFAAGTCKRVDDRW
jgi:hypothetical protein